jgi:hypothetical protein
MAHGFAYVPPYTLTPGQPSPGRATLLRHPFGLPTTSLGHGLGRIVPKDSPASRLSIARFDMGILKRWNLAVFVLSSTGLFRNETPQFIDIDSWAIVLIGFVVKVTLTNLSKISRMVFVKVDSVVLETTSVTTTARMLSVFSNTSVTSADVTSLSTILV